MEIVYFLSVIFEVERLTNELITEMELLLKMGVYAADFVG